MIVRALVLHVLAGAVSAQSDFLAAAGSAVGVLQRHWYTGHGSWIGHGPGNGAGRFDACTANASQPCTCNGYQGNWVRANTVEALCNYQINSGSREYDGVIAASWPHEGFEVNAAAPFPCDPTSPDRPMPNADPGWPFYDDVLWWALASLRAADM
jgi:hypothetical protein